MKITTLLIVIPTVLFPMAAYAETSSENADAPEIDACRANGLIALKEHTPTIIATADCL